MNGIVALVGGEGPPLDVASLRAPLDAMRHRSRRPPWSFADGRAALGGCDGALAEGTRAAGPAPRIVVTADARLDPPQERRAELGLPPDATTAAWIAALYDRFGDDCVAHLHGEFAFALWDAPRRRLLCARDRFGVKPLYVLRQAASPSFACASEIGALLALARPLPPLRAARVAAHLETLFEEGPGTWWESIERLLPAHRLVVDERGVRVDAWWSLRAPPLLRLRSLHEYEEAFRARLADAVGRRLRGAERAGSLLSGGLDSSSIVAFAQRALAAAGRPPLRTLSLVFAGRPEQDERRYVEPVVARHGVDATYIEATAVDPVADAFAHGNAGEGPIAGGNVCFNRTLDARAQELGVDVLLDGTDGDTIVSHGIGRFAELFARGRWLALAREARQLAATLHRPARDLVRRYALTPVARRFARRSPWMRALVRRLRGIDGSRAADSLLRPDVAQRFGFVELRRRADAATTSVDAYVTEQELHLASLVVPLHAFSFEQFDRLAAGYGIEPRYPMFDLPFVEFCLSVPAERKLSGGWTRRLLRSAMAPLLPEAVAWRREKSNFSSGFLHALVRYVREPATPVPEEAWLERLGDFIDADHLRRTVARLRSSPSVDDALTTWKVLTLFLWLHAPPASAEVPARTRIPQ